MATILASITRMQAELRWRQMDFAGQALVLQAIDDELPDCVHTTERRGIMQSIDDLRIRLQVCHATNGEVEQERTQTRARSERLRSSKSRQETKSVRCKNRFPGSQMSIIVISLPRKHHTHATKQLICPLRILKWQVLNNYLGVYANWLSKWCELVV